MKTKQAQRGLGLIICAMMLGMAMIVRADTVSGDSDLFTFDTRTMLASAMADSPWFTVDTRNMRGLSASDSANFVFDTRGGMGAEASSISALFTFDTRSGRVVSMAIGGPAECSPGANLRFECWAWCDDGTYAEVGALCNWWIDGAAPAGTFVSGGQFTAGNPSVPTSVHLRAGYKRPDGYVISPPYEVAIAKALTVQMGAAVATPNGSAGDWDLNVAHSTVAGAYGPVVWQWQLDGVTLDGMNGPALGWRVTGAAGTRLLTVIATDGQGRRASAALKVVFNKPPVANEPFLRQSAEDPQNGAILDYEGKPFKFITPHVANGLIIVTHGLKSSGTSPWIQQLALSMDVRLIDEKKPLPNICIYDWEDSAQPTWQPDVDAVHYKSSLLRTLKGVSELSWAALTLLPDIALIRPNAITQGRALADWISTNVVIGNIDPNAPIHLIGHSAGGFTMGECAYLIKKQGIINGDVQVTVLDTPYIFSDDMKIMEKSETAGSRCRIERYSGNPPFAIGTIEPLFGSIEPGVGYYRRMVGLAPFFRTLDAHAWVHDWYKEETTDYYYDTENDGFYYSPFMGNGFHGQSFSVSLQAFRSAENNLSLMETPLSGFSTFGNVILTDGVYRITEESNAGLIMNTNLPIGAQTIRFRYHFAAAGDGDFLVVYWGTNNAPLFIGADLEISRTSFLEGSVPVAIFAGETNQLIFELVSRSETNAVVEIDQIRLEVTDDPDGDGLTTDQEAALSTDPLKSDTDGDGLTDGDEVTLYNSNPLLVDSDGDGVPDGMEIRAGTDPTDPESCFKIVRTETAVAGGQLILTWNGKVGRTYRINRRTDLKQQDYDTVATGIPGVEPYTSYPIPSSAQTFPISYYWVEME